MLVDLFSLSSKAGIKSCHVFLCVIKKKIFILFVLVSEAWGQTYGGQKGVYLCLPVNHKPALYILMLGEVILTLASPLFKLELYHAWAFQNKNTKKPKTNPWS